MDLSSRQNFNTKDLTVNSRKDTIHSLLAPDESIMEEFEEDELYNSAFAYVEYQGVNIQDDHILVMEGEIWVLQYEDF
jgi:hypothetical protein